MQSGWTGSQHLTTKYFRAPPAQVAASHRGGAVAQSWLVSAPTASTISIPSRAGRTIHILQGMAGHIGLGGVYLVRAMRACHRRRQAGRAASHWSVAQRLSNGGREGRVQCPPPGG
jgi:hypothetical protein